MRKTKLCPLKKGHEADRTGTVPVFHPCLEDSCAWWILVTTTQVNQEEEHSHTGPAWRDKLVEKHGWIQVGEGKRNEKKTWELELWECCIPRLVTVVEQGAELVAGAFRDAGRY